MNKESKDQSLIQKQGSKEWHNGSVRWFKNMISTLGKDSLISHATKLILAKSKDYIFYK